uniref:Uncharacterized protein n=1 Tax=Panagrolaimus sp. JU765 TaxID=591449 RepID=A0AC34QLI1_9BILA
MLIILLSLAIAEISGMGTVDPRTQMVDASTLRSIVPFGPEGDDGCCCCGIWPTVNEPNHFDELENDRQVWEKIEKGKLLNENDLTSDTNSFGVFLPEFAVDLTDEKIGNGKANKRSSTK